MGGKNVDYFVRRIFVRLTLMVSFTGCLTGGKIDNSTLDPLERTVHVYPTSATLQARSSVVDDAFSMSASVTTASPVVG